MLFFWLFADYSSVFLKYLLIVRSLLAYSVTIVIICMTIMMLLLPPDLRYQKQETHCILQPRLSGPQNPLKKLHRHL